MLQSMTPVQGYNDCIDAICLAQPTVRNMDVKD